MTQSNYEVAKDFLTFSGPFSEEERWLAVDPQTSGGLLISLPADQAPPLAQRLRERGNMIAAVIGEVVPAEGKSGLEFLKNGLPIGRSLADEARLATSRVSTGDRVLSGAVAAAETASRFAALDATAISGTAETILSGRRLADAIIVAFGTTGASREVEGAVDVTGHTAPRAPL